jgi:tetratricopeptide (TPR) repeat protein
MRLSGAFWRSAVAAAIFALHPLRIESVVWIAERKDVLSSLFFLSAIWCYLRYVEQPSRGRYNTTLAVYALGLMSKPMVMTLPLVLMLLDWRLLGRRAFAEKAPMFVLAAVSSFLTSRGTSAVTVPVALWQRVANGVVSYRRYVELSVWPRKLAILYPLRATIPPNEVVIAALLLAAVTGVALWQSTRRPYLIVGWLWFVVSLLPASGVVVQVGRQAMADRFTYIPHIGLIMAIVWTTADLLNNQRREVLAVLSALSIGALAVASYSHLPVWRDSVTLFGDTVAVTADNPTAQHYLAVALDGRGRFDEALPHHAEAVRLQPDYFLAQFSYGLALENRHQTAAAIDHFSEALHYFPEYAEARTHLEENRKRLEPSSASPAKSN